MEKDNGRSREILSETSQARDNGDLDYSWDGRRYENMKAT